MQGGLRLFAGAAGILELASGVKFIAHVFVTLVRHRLCAG